MRFVQTMNYIDYAILFVNITENVKRYRQQYAENCLPDAQFWLDWTAEAMAMNEPDCPTLFELALTQCPHTELVLLYLSYQMQRYEDEALVGVCLFKYLSSQLVGSLI